jgi:hypothetical protein
LGDFTHSRQWALIGLLKIAQWVFDWIFGGFSTRTSRDQKNQSEGLNTTKKGRKNETNKQTNKQTRQRKEAEFCGIEKKTGGWFVQKK